jgi:hypothetical protein
LDFLRALTNVLGVSIELAWDIEPWQGVKAIEVYPAATYIARRMEGKSFESLSKYCGFGTLDITVLKNPHVADAIICAIAGADFLDDLSVAPSGEHERVRREGWIWAAERDMP